MITTIGFTVCHTPHGDMIAASTEFGVCRLLPPGAGLDALYAWAEQRLPHAHLQPVAGADQGLEVQLTAYFAGDLTRFDVPLDLHGTPFQLAVWSEVSRIPYGEMRSYAEVSRAVGRPAAWRAVGAANAVCPVGIVIPCHRVVGGDGTVKGDRGHLLNRALLLGIEGNTVRSDPAEADTRPAPRWRGRR